MAISPDVLPMSQTSKPKRLRRGSTIRFVSPSSPITEEKTSRLTEILQNQGYQLSFSENSFAADYYLAGTDRQRAEDLMNAFIDPTVDAVLCNRGGYGCARLLPYLDLDLMAASRKLFVGFSDITTIHLALNRRGLPTAHGPMSVTLSVDRPQWVIDSYLAMLSGEDPIPADAPTGKTLTPGVAEGIVTGGCLCLLTDSIGTQEPLEAEGKILLIEDVDEAPHRVDAMLTQLLNTGILQSAAGIVVGEMTRTDEKADASIGAKPWRDIVAERLSGLRTPAILDFPFGHAPAMLSLPLGIKARLDADKGTLTYLEPLCDD